jgi:hypothetical protein
MRSDPRSDGLLHLLEPLLSSGEKVVLRPRVSSFGLLLRIHFSSTFFAMINSPVWSHFWMISAKTKGAKDAVTQRLKVQWPSRSGSFQEVRSADENGGSSLSTTPMDAIVAREVGKRRLQRIPVNEAVTDVRRV